ncbi:MAG: O-antigen ligase family protein [Candidatus Pacebacteria bacterium]|nr:O-antigen ligase family protein [Candidatus Paceibacterota bacterium]
MKINFKSILFYLTIAALLTPFFVDTQTYFPYIIGKATIFRIIVGLMLIIWSLQLFERQSSKKYISNLLNSLPLLTKSILIFGLIIFISAVFGVDFYYSFFPGNERMEGVLGIWYFIAFFFVIANTFRSLEIEKILKTQVFISLIYSFFALLPYLNLGQLIAPITSSRLTGYTGNPSFFATYLFFNTFLALYFYFRQYTYNKKLFNYWLIIFFLQSFLIFVTLTRGAMLGYLISIVLVVLAMIFLSKDKNILPFRKIGTIFLIIILVFSTLIFIGKNTDFVKNNSILNRFTSISLTDPTALSRIFSAEIAWKSFLQKPIFGWGQENYEAAYVQNFNPEVLKYLPEDFYFDRAHNKPMEVLATNGIFGFLSYLSIFGIAFYFLNQLRKRQEWFLPSLAIGGCLAGYFIQNIFLFDFHESYLMFFLVLAFIVSLSEIVSLHSSKAIEKNNKANNYLDYASKMGSYLMIVIIICSVSFSTIQWVFKPYLVSKGISRTGYFMKQGQGEKAFQELRKITSRPTFFEDDIVIAVKKMYSLYSFKITEEDKKSILGLLYEVAEERAAKRPWRFTLINTKADLETMLSQWDRDYLLKAEESVEMILSQFPYFPSSHLFASKFFVLNGEIERGIQEAEKVIEVDPKIATAYYILGSAYNEIEELEKAGIYLVKAAELNYPFKDKGQILYVINFLIEEKKYSIIEKLYLQAIQVDPQDVSLYTSLAATYGRMQNKEKAIEYAKKAVELNPAIQESANEFIQLVENEQWEIIAD